MLPMEIYVWSIVYKISNHLSDVQQMLDDLKIASWEEKQKEQS